MRFKGLFGICIFLLLLVLSLPLFDAQGQNYIQYRVQVNSDGSAAWNITQVSGTNGTVDTWAGFQRRVASLIDAAANQTQREMSLDPSSPQISTVISSNESKITSYVFVWLNFSIVQNTSLTFGDAFSVVGFFNQLYGDGALQITYPSSYTLTSVSPAPDQRSDSTQTLEWLGTQFFVNGSPNIELSAVASSTSSPTPSQTSNNIGWELFVLAGVGAVVGAALAVGWVLRRHRQNTVRPTRTLVIESEEEKIVKIIQSNGGTMLQSVVTEQSRFSKAKASQLLSALEKKGVVRRYKKGRDKIVTLASQGKGE